MADTGLFGLETDFSDSYNVNSGDDVIRNFEPLGEYNGQLGSYNGQYGINPQQLQQDSVAEMIKRSISQQLSNPGIDALPMDQYLPGIDRPLEVGKFSGPLGSVPLFAEGAGYTPWGVLEAKNAAKQTKLDEYQQQMLQGLTFDYKNIKDKIRNENWIATQSNIWNDYLGRKKAEAGGNMMVAGVLAKDDPERKLIQARIDNATAAFDNYYDKAVEMVMQFESGRSDVYVNKKQYETAKEFLGFYAKDPKQLTLDNLKEFNPQQFVTAMAINKAAEKTMEIRQKENMDNATSKIIAAVTDGTLGSLNTDSENVYNVQKTIGLGDEFVREISEADYNVAYGSAIEHYENSEDIVPSRQEFYDYYKKLVHQQVTDALHNVNKMNPLERAQTAKIRQDMRSDVVRQVNRVKDPVTGKWVEHYEWSLVGDNIDVSGKTIDLPASKYKVVKISHGKAGASGYAEATATVAPYTLKDVVETDNRGRRVVTKRYVVDYDNQKQVKYSNVESELSKHYNVDNEPNNPLPVLEQWQGQTLRPAAESGVGGKAPAPYGATIEQDGVTYDWNGYEYKAR